MSTLTLDMLRASIRELRAQQINVPKIWCSSEHKGGPVTISREVAGAETLIISPDDMREIHKRIPMRLVCRLSPNTGEYAAVMQFDGPFPLELELPPFEGSL